MNARTCRCPPAARPADAGSRGRRRSRRRSQRRMQAAVNSGIALGRTQDRDRAARALDLACEQLGTAREHAPAMIAKTAVELAVEIARTIVHVQIESGRLGLEAMVREAAPRLRSRARRVRRAPQSARRRRARGHQVPRRHSDRSRRSVQRGDVHVSTAQGLLVREVHDALRSVRERLLAELANDRSGTRARHDPRRRGAALPRARGERLGRARRSRRSAGRDRRAVPHPARQLERRRRSRRLPRAQHAADAARRHRGHRPMQRVIALKRPFSVPVGEHLLGRVLDGFAHPSTGCPHRARANFARRVRTRPIHWTARRSIARCRPACARSTEC